MIIENADYFVRVVDLPAGVGGLVTPNDDGTFSIYVNARNSREKQKKSCDHEVGHIEHDDFYRDVPIEQMEKEANE